MVSREEFDAAMDAALEPESYPGDDAILMEPQISDDPVGERVVFPAEVPARDRWSIEDRSGAVWAIRRYRSAKDEIASAQALRDEMVAHADAWLERVLPVHERNVRFFTGKLREFYETEVEKVKGKTVVLPGAKLKGSVGGVTTDVRDEEALLAWLRENLPSAIRPPIPVPPRPDLVAVKAKLGGKVDKSEPGEYPAVDAESGDIAPGVVFVRGEKRFEVELTEDGER